MHQRHLRLALATATAAALTGGLLTFSAVTATAADSTTVPQADFNNDGIGDTAFSADGAYVGGKKNAGQLVVLYGTRSGVSSAQRSVVSQNTTGTPGTAETGDGFGVDSAYADFNGDGYDDLAVGSPGEDVGDDTDGGSLAVLWGSASGITGKGVTIPDPAPGKHDRWGKTLAAGDFDGDGKADLAVGSTGAAVYVFKDGISGDGTTGGQYTVTPPIASHDGAGALHLTAGDVTGDGRTDLVVDGYENTTEHGWNRNYYFPGVSGGLSDGRVKELKAGIVSGIGDINHDGYGDIVTGASWNGDPNSATGGKIWITYGTADGPGTVKGITQDTGSVPGTSEKDDHFGWDLDLGDINGDGFQDLVIGAPGENIGAITDAGMVTVLYGTASGLNTSSGAQSFAQSTAGVPGEDEANDAFGADAKLDDVNGDGRADLLVGSYENDGNGAVLYLPSNGSKLTTAGSRTVSPSAVGVSTTGVPAFGVNFAD
ncbi:FG-GAP and VCBS repeat-containing protein [Streptomyces sp. NPDC051913]|uniref:FG-GAP and VCBS repeat-containing protein n=1 Tax=Streptomyces sp. NPDC051913 TaxID=3365676 RepID=UPI0037CE5B86